MVSNNFSNHKIQIKSDCKITIKVLLDVSQYLWRMLSISKVVKKLISSINNVELLWCSKDYNENVHKVVKWITQIIGIGTRHLCDIPPNIESYMLHNSFSVYDK